VGTEVPRCLRSSTHRQEDEMANERTTLGEDEILSAVPRAEVLEPDADDEDASDAGDSDGDDTDGTDGDDTDGTDGTDGTDDADGDDAS
jgi:hypothetical protein